MAYTALIDRYRIIHAITEQDPRPSEWVALKAELASASLVPKEVALTTFPAGYRRGRVLSDDNSTCTEPAPDHASRGTDNRRLMVVEWAKRNSNTGAVLYGFRVPTRMGIWLNVLRCALAAAASRDFLNGSSWALYSAGLEVDYVSFMENAGSGWTSKQATLAGLRGLYMPRQTTDGPVNPVRLPLATAQLLESGRDFADGVLYGRQ